MRASGGVGEEGKSGNRGAGGGGDIRRRRRRWRCRGRAATEEAEAEYPARIYFRRPPGPQSAPSLPGICFRRPPGPRAAPLPGRGELGLLPPHDKPMTLLASSALASFLLCSGSASSLCSSLLPRLLWFSSSPRERLENAWASLGALRR